MLTILEGREEGVALGLGQRVQIQELVERAKSTGLGWTDVAGRERQQCLRCLGDSQVDVCAHSLIDLSSECSHNPFFICSVVWTYCMGWEMVWERGWGSSAKALTVRVRIRALASGREDPLQAQLGGGARTGPGPGTGLVELFILTPSSF